MLDNPTETPEPETGYGEIDSGRGVHSYVNRVLDRAASPAGVDDHFSAHSFRRGGAQHANSSSAQTAQWIFDRGAWNMNTTSKAFAYVFNTLSEDARVARVLSGRQADEETELLSLDCFDTHTQQRVRSVMVKLFFASHKLSAAHRNANLSALDMLAAYLLLHLPSLHQLSASSFIVKRVEECATDAGVMPSEVLAWSALRTASESASSSKRSCISSHDQAIVDHPLFLQQSALIDEPVAVNTKLDQRLRTMESAFRGEYQAEKQQHERPAADQSSKRRKKAAPANLADTWFM